MKVFLVGGAVRDRLLGIEAAERDWVVVGALPEDLEALGYRRVGRSFPVFLHPETGEEYALARTERKTGPGYRGFEVRADPSVTLEEDLRRRDLTINAIARGESGELIDPWGGQADIDARRLRHVSDAFREDPVRILRAARFAARFHDRGFVLADETIALMRDMVAAGEAGELVPERVWRETDNALGSARPDVFFSTLRDCGALAVIYPEVDALFGVPQTPEHHPEIDCGEHLLLCLRAAAEISAEREVAFAVLCHDLGKAQTPADTLPRHIGHEASSVALTEQLCDRLGTPNRYRELAVQVARYHGQCHRAAELRPATRLKLLEALDVFRRPERLEQFLAACIADARGRRGHEQDDYPQADILRRAHTAASSVEARQLAERGFSGAQLGEALRRERIAAIRADDRAQMKA